MKKISSIIEAHMESSNTNQTLPQTPASYQPVIYNKSSNSSGRGIRIFIIILLILLVLGCFCSGISVFLASIPASLETSSKFKTSDIKQRVLYTLRPSATEQSRIAVINITGPINYALPGNKNLGDTNSEAIITQLQKAERDSSIAAVILRMNTPGGEVSAAEPICKAIKDVNSSKPVYAFVDTLSASLGYLLSNCTRSIYAKPEAITGSIGVIIQAIDYYGVLEKFGGKVVFITNTEGKYKSSQDIYQTGSETYKMYQKILDENYSYFLSKVLEGRKKNHSEMTLEQLKRYADGRVFSGLQAKEANLVDKISSFEETVDDIVQNTANLRYQRVDVIEYYIPSNGFADLFSNLNASLKSVDLKSQVQNNSGIKIQMRSDLIPMDRKE